MVSRSIYLVFLIIAASSAYVLVENDDPEESVIWPSEYSYKAEDIDLVNAFIENFQVWYSAEHNRSRIDYNNGTNKIYYIAESDDDMGYQYEIHPITTETVRNENICIQSYSEGEQRDFLPNLDGYEYSHEELENGRTVRVWIKEEESEDEEHVTVKSTMYVYRTDYDFDVPVKVIAKALNLVDGSIQANMIRNYLQFTFIVTADEVTLKDEDCNEPVDENPEFKAIIDHLHPHDPAHVEKAFHSYKKHHGKTYKQNEQAMRKAIFHKNWKIIRAHNLKNLGYKMELNVFADRTPEELNILAGTRPSSPTAVGTMPFPHSDEEIKELAEDLPDSYDMRFLGYVGPIKNQGECGSCWAFSTTATVEGALSKSNGGRNVDLSEQSLVDCAWGFENSGCNGGQLDKAYEYILKHGIPFDSQYEYRQKDGYCKVDNTTDTFKIRGFGLVTPRNPEALKLALVKYGPVSIAIRATRNMYLYTNGIFYDINCDGLHVNHGVVVVGYGERDGTPYWIVRNSWGENWGQDGYILMSALNDNCKVMDSPYYPIV
ncbi:cathepsin K-like [Ostrinia nubilalis]|uniref:cathepsin K-like n=1 Tax=Ostrinia nubilalis TaxID=29057 RepID=UPI00308243CC